MNSDSVTRKVATAISHALSPATVIVALCLLIAAHATGTVRGTIGWGLATALFTSIIPTAVVAVHIRLGLVTDFHVRDRRQRVKPLMAAVVSAAAGVVVVHLFDAPAEVAALALTLLIGAAATTVITRWWKISFHTGVSASAVIVLAAVFGAWLLVAMSVVSLIGWARVHLGAHSIAQAVVGAAGGAGVAAIAGIAYVLALGS